MMRKGIFILAAFVIFSFSPTTSHAQVSEDEYRSYLLELIDLLQQQIIELQKQHSAIVGTVKTIESTKANFESFLIEDIGDIEARYEISDSKAVSQIPNSTHRQYFERFFELVPDAYDSYFSDLLVFDETLEEFDGFVETIPPYKEDTWRIGINESVFEFKSTSELVEELFIHEFAHIIAYEGIQGTIESRNRSCHEYFDEFGCPPSNSYLIDFVDEFWTKEDLDALVEFAGESIWTNKEIKNNFVTDYASTNPAEDFAESFTFFVFDGRSDSIDFADDKINYFYNFSKMVLLRNEILNAL